MSEKLDALIESAAHWTRLLTLYKSGDPVGVSEEGYSSNQCALCDLYLEETNCEECPVKEYTDQRSCEGTPYVPAFTLLEKFVTGGQGPTSYGESVLVSQIKFLKMLHKQEQDNA